MPSVECLVVNSEEMGPTDRKSGERQLLPFKQRRQLSIAERFDGEQGGRTAMASPCVACKGEASCRSSNRAKPNGESLRAWQSLRKNPPKKG